MPKNWNVAAMLRAQAESRPSEKALAFPSGTSGGRTTWDWLTFGELDALSDTFARGFEATGLESGDRTLLLLKPSFDFYGVIFGLLKMGAVPVLMDPGMGVKPLLGCISQIGPVATVAIPPVHVVRLIARGSFASVKKPYTAGGKWFWGGHNLAQVKAAGAGDTPYEIRSYAAEEEAAVVFTSGSTGLPKGVSYRHASFTAATEQIRDVYGLGPGTRVVECFAPFAIFDLCMGSTCIIPDMNLSKPATAQPERIADALQLNEATVAFASPIVWANTVRWCQKNKVTFPSLTKVLAAGAPIPPDLHRRFQDVLPVGAEVHTPYGCTEGMPVANVSTNTILGETAAKTAAGQGTCVGTLAPQIRVRIIGITEEAIPTWSDDLELPQGEIGEIVLGGPVVSPEYKENPDANRKSKIQEGDAVLHRMGDLAYFDEQGRLWFCGRKGHRLQTQQGMVPAVPVEGVFNEHPKVLRTALVGVGQRGAEVPVLCVQAEEGETFSAADAEEMLALAAGTRWEGVVSTWLLHTAFPTDARHNSKIRREDLKVWATKQLAGKLQGAA